MTRLIPLAAFSLAALLLAATPAWAAGDDHGHDHGDAAPAAAGPALPRFAAVSDAFELVGVLKGQQLTLYLDRAADNSPVSEAQIELEIGGQAFKAQKQGDDAFEVVLQAPPKPGLLPITATVTVGTETDLLAGELDIHEAAHGDATPRFRPWQQASAWAAGGFALLAALVIASRRWRSSRKAAAGAAA